jgi:hypothetical protein
MPPAGAASAPRFAWDVSEHGESLLTALFPQGNVNKIKMIKRQMYGRAGFALLRKRVILHPA